MLKTNPAEAVENLSTFDAEEFALWTTISKLIPKADRGETYRLKAVDHVDHAEGLLKRAMEYSAKPEDHTLIVSALLEGVTLRLAAATHCRGMSGAWTFLHQLETD